MRCEQGIYIKTKNKMKRVLFHTVFAVIALIVFTACAARQTAAEKEAIAIDIRNALERGEFRFIYNPIGGTGQSYVYVSPYIVRSSSSLLGGVYEITDFEYNVTSRRGGTWLVQIAFRGFLFRETVLNFEIWEDGSATYHLSRPNWQSVFRSGHIEVLEDNLLAVNDIDSIDD